MSKYTLLRSFKKNISQCRLAMLPYSMLNKPPTINPPVEPVQIEDKPIDQSSENYAMRVYMENVNRYNKFMSEQKLDFDTGKRHLANMMGCDPETFTQEDIDEAIRYLFPCSLFAESARPIMKPPDKIFPPKKEAEFDMSGRPYHPFFYTVTPNFYSIMHEAIKVFKNLDDYEDKVIRGEIKNPGFEKILLENSCWKSKEALQQLCCEPLSDKQYINFTTTFDRLVAHPYAKRAEEFILKHRDFNIITLKSTGMVETVELEDGRKLIRSEFCRQRRALAHVNVIYPGTGKVSFNGVKSIDFFENIQSKEQILFPLVLTGLLNKVDIDAEILQGGSASMAEAVRLGISRGLAHFVDEEMKEKMRLAGLLTRDPRLPERKKPGQKGARAKYKWRKR